MHIVMGTGIYHEAHHPDSIAGLNDTEIAEILVRDITEGVDGTGIRAGIIGEQGTFTGPMTEREAVVFRASAMAAVETGWRSPPTPTWGSTRWIRSMSSSPRASIRIASSSATWTTGSPTST